MTESHLLPADIAELAQRVVAENRVAGRKLTVAESCTGGLVAASLTEVPGSSAVLDRGFVTYSNAAKSELLGVPAELIAQHGAVSEPVARAMAGGAVRHAHAQVSVAVTGIAGPTGGSADKPVGTVWFAWCVDEQLSSEQRVFEGDRATVREATVAYALAGLLKRLG